MIASRESTAKPLDSYVHTAPLRVPASPAVAPRPAHQPRKKTLPQEKTRKKTGVMPRSIAQTILLALAVVLAFGSVTLLLTRNETITKANIAINTQKQELKELRLEEEQLQLDLAMAGQLSSIRDRAQDELGFVVPDSDQVQYVDVDPSTSANTTTEPSEEQSSNLFDKILSLFE